MDRCKRALQGMAIALVLSIGAAPLAASAKTRETPRWTGSCASAQVAFGAMGDAVPLKPVRPLTFRLPTCEALQRPLTLQRLDFGVALNDTGFHNV